MALVLILFVVALVLFATELLPVDVTALLLLGALLVGGQLKPDEAFAGFGSDTVLTLAALFVLTRALLRTGVIERLSLALGRRSRSPHGVLRLLLSAVAGLSAFTSNTATTAVFLPVVLGFARRARVGAGRVMMPLAYASILGGTITVIGTSTNLVVSGAMPRFGLAPLGFFELAWVGLPITVLGMLYLFLVAPRLLPDRGEAEEGANTPRAYVAELSLDGGSGLAGQTLRGAALGRDYGLTVVEVRRGGRVLAGPGADFVLEAGDRLTVEGPMERLIAAKSTLGVHLRSERKLLERLDAPERAAVRLVEAVVMPRSALLGRTLREARFRERTGLSVLALHRLARPGPLSRTRFQVGDVLLLQGPTERIDALDGDLTVMSDVTERQRETRHAPLALLLFVGAIGLGATGVVPLSVAVVTATALLFAARVLSPEEGYRAIEWNVLVLIACMLAFGTAFEKSGAAEAVSGWIADVARPLGPRGLLAAFFVLTVALTQPMSNQAAALVMLPLAVGVAKQLGLDPRPFVIAVAIAASNSFVTPLEPASLLVFGPGRYRFLDFVRVGSGLTLLSFAVAMIVIPWRWPF